MGVEHQPDMIYIYIMEINGIYIYISYIYMIISEDGDLKDIALKFVIYT